MPMWCPEKKGRRNNWPFKLAPLGHYSSSPIALILLLKRLHRHSEGAPQIWPKVDQQKYVENSKLSILFSSIFLLAQPSCPSLSIVFRLWWSFGGAWCFENNSKRQYWRTTIHQNKKHFLKKRIAIYKKKRKGKGQIFLKNIFLVQLSPFIDRLYLSQPNWVLHLWATGSINHPFSATLKRSVNLSHD